MVVVFKWVLFRLISITIILVMFCNIVPGECHKPSLMIRLMVQVITQCRQATTHHNEPVLRHQMASPGHSELRCLDSISHHIHHHIKERCIIFLHQLQWWHAVAQHGWIVAAWGLIAMNIQWCDMSHYYLDDVWFYGHENNSPYLSVLGTWALSHRTSNAMGRNTSP